MTPQFVDSDDALAGPFYGLGVLLMLVPLLDFVTSVLPLHVINLQWRFATIGLFSNFLLTPLLGMGLLITVAAVREHYRVQRLLAIANSCFALLVVGLLVLFSLDIVQLNASVPPERASEFHMAAFKAVAKYVLGWMVVVSLAVAGWRISSSTRPDRHR